MRTWSYQMRRRPQTKDDVATSGSVQNFPQPSSLPRLTRILCGWRASKVVDHVGDERELTVVAAIIVGLGVVGVIKPKHKIFNVHRTAAEPTGFKPAAGPA
jgi:hypothetical protein